MKVLCIPDIHGNFTEAIKNIDDHYNEVDKVVVLGDYFDSFDSSVNGQPSAEGFKKLLKKAKDSNGKIDLLIGNHDFAYIGDPRVSGHQTGNIAIVFCNLLLDAIDSGVMKVAVKYDDRVYSHAGFSKRWLEETYPDLDLTKPKEIIDTVNKSLKIGPRHMFDFNLYDMSSCGNSVFQGPLWIRPRYLIEQPAFKVQVVGHSEVSPEMLKNGRCRVGNEKCTVFICDSPAHSTWSIFTEFTRAKQYKSRDFLKRNLNWYRLLGKPKKQFACAHVHDTIEARIYNDNLSAILSYERAVRTANLALERYLHAKKVYSTYWKTATEDLKHDYIRTKDEWITASNDVRLKKREKKAALNCIQEYHFLQNQLYTLRVKQEENERK